MREAPSSRSRVLHRFAAAATVAISAALLVGAVEPQGSNQSFVVPDRSVFGRMRIFAKPGDVGVRSGSATAIVRKSDGALVDFWPAKPAAPSTLQLGKTTNADGIWLVQSKILHGDDAYKVETNDVRDAGDHVETLTQLTVGSSRVTVHQEFRLSSEAPRLILSSRIVHDSGPSTLEFDFEDEVRWGNVVSYAAGIGALPESFAGRARWVGRKGASGDLVLRAADDRELDIEIIPDHPGFRSPLHVRYGQITLEPGASATVGRLLAYQHITVPAPPPETASLSVRIVDEAGLPLPSKLTLRGIDGTLDPDFGDEGNETGANRFVWSGNGRFTRAIRPGRYSVLATAGPERDARSWTVQIDEHEIERLDGVLAHVVPTPGWIAADLHLHQVPSVDADIGFSTRVISIAAEGLEFAVATDHYYVTDLAPTVRALQRTKTLSRPLMTLAGTEVSTTGNRFGHFNLYPAPLDSRIAYHDTTPVKLFESMRAASPDGIVQVNHPRWTAIGYFRAFDMDPETAAVPTHRQAEYSDAFDAIEVYNGLDVGTTDGVMKVFADWLHLLGRGHRYTATGSSDSHKLFFIDPGVPRTMIYVGGASDEADVRADPSSVIAAVKAGRVLVTSGPFIEATIDGKGPGETARVSKRTVDLNIRVRAAPWIDVREVAVYVGGNERPVVLKQVAPSTKAVRYEGTLPLAVPKETFVIALARGETPLPNVYSKNAKPLAFTNPIWIKRAETVAPAPVKRPQ